MQWWFDGKLILQPNLLLFRIITILNAKSKNLDSCVSILNKKVNVRKYDDSLTQSNFLLTKTI